jgi:hypothetical protein
MYVIGGSLVVKQPPDDGLPYHGEPDRNRYVANGRTRVLCVPCARILEAQLDGDEPETDEPCEKCKAGAEYGLSPIHQAAPIVMRAMKIEEWAEKTSAGEQLALI